MLVFILRGDDKNQRKFRYSKILTTSQDPQVPKSVLGLKVLTDQQINILLLHAHMTPKTCLCNLKMDRDVNKQIMKKGWAVETGHWVVALT